MIKHESKFGILFRQWERSVNRPTEAYELKDTRGKNQLNFHEIKEEQLDYAYTIKHHGALIRVIGFNGEPDYIKMQKRPSWIVIRYPDFFVMIDIDVFKNFMQSGGKSIDAEDAKTIAYVTVNCGRI